MPGSGTNEPFGIITGTTNTVNATTGQTTDAEAARYQARASYMASGTITNILHRLVGGASTEPPLVSEDRTRLLGKPLVIDSEMATVTTTGTKCLLYGDLSRYYIIDRIGLTIELIPISSAQITGPPDEGACTVFGATPRSSLIPTRSGR